MDIMFKGEDNRIALAREPAFSLADIHVEPATRQVTRGAATETLEPRVMQVLVALARAGGKVVPRDDLVDMCWEGRIVGDNAINRVVSRLRSLAAGFGAGSFEIETIVKVGYRLVVTAAAPVIAPVEVPEPSFPAAHAEARPASWTRRAAIVGVGLAAAGGMALALRPKPHQPPPMARQLFEKGLAAQREGLSEATVQAIAFLEEATRIDPDFADAWGALALSYRHRLENDPTIDAARQAEWVRAAADRATALDPGNADADVARLLVRPFYRNWTGLERQYRTGLARHPDHWLLRGSFGALMCNVGRWSEAIPAFRRNVEREAFLPMARNYLTYALWNAGRLHEAEAVVTAARQRWPTHPSLWTSHFNFLAYEGRSAEAGELLARANQRPLSFDAAMIDRLAMQVRAFGGTDPAAVAATIADGLETAGRNAASIPRVAQQCVLLGRPEPVFALLDSYFHATPLAAGMAPGTIGPLTRRYTDFLFTRALAPLRPDPRYAALLRSTGLEGYWTASGSTPDFR